MIEDISSLETNGFKVLAKSIYVPEISNVKKSKYFFAYIIRIINQSQISATLRRRYWEITDGFGKIDIVKGEGVIGRQPKIEPGDYYVYSSYCPIKTTYGFMKGYYEMENNEGNFLPTF